MKSKIFISFLLMLLFTIISSEAKAQRRRGRNVPPVVMRDSIAQTAGDTLNVLRTDTVVVSRDTTKVSKKDYLEAPVTYEANDSVSFTQGGFAHLYGSGKINYQQIELSADVITMNMDSSTVFAHGVTDSTGVSSGIPVFKEGDTSYETQSIRYNFNSRKGIIANIESQQGEGYVIGNNAKKGSGDEIYLKDGRYTTCDNHEHPHFYLQLTYAKVKPKKSVVTGPAYLVVEDVPLPLAVPFFFFPFNSSYSSGFIMPTYMDDSNRGFGLTDGGYYFAISDKMDLRVTGDIFTKGSWAMRAATNYVKRYRYSGTFQADYQITQTGDKGLPDFNKTKDFKIVWSHRQDAKANPNSTFTASVNFSTSSYERTNIGNLYNAQAMSQNTKTSSVSYSRSFPDKKLSISTTMNIAQTMRDSSISMTLPDLNITLSTIFPFKRKNAVGNERWYEKIQLRYSGRFSNSIKTKDNLIFKKNLIRDWQNGMQHNIPVSATFTLFKYFNVTPQVNYTERWYTHKIEKDWDRENNTVMNDTIYGFNRVYDFSGSLGVNTKVYAMYKPIFMKKRDIQIRHIMTPSVSLSATPDFTSDTFGYYGTYLKPNSAGLMDTVRYSYYEGQLFSPTFSGKSGNVNFQISNNLEMKYRDKNDSIHKVSLIDELGASMSYNMAAKKQPWSNLNMTLRLKLTKSYTFSMNAVFATYAYEFDKNGNVIVGDRTEWSYGRFGRFQGYGTSFNYTLNNQSIKKIIGFFTGNKVEDEGNNPNQEQGNEGENPPNDPNNPPQKKKVKAEAGADGYQAYTIPWSINISTGFNISEDRTKPINPHNMRYPYSFKLNSLNINGNVRFSNKWAMTFNSGYDFENKKVVQTAFNLSRDLHCFTMTASISPFGVYKYYNFTIRATASILQDLKWDQRSQTQSNIRWY